MAPKVSSAKPSGSGSVPKESPTSPSPSKRKEKTASLSKDQIRKCLLRYVDNILCLDDIQGVVSLHQLGLLPREEVNSVFDDEEGRAEKTTVRSGGSVSRVKKHAEEKGGGGENTWDKKEWEFLEGIMRGDLSMGAGGGGLPLLPGTTSAVRRLVLCISRTSRSLARSLTHRRYYPTRRAACCLRWFRTAIIRTTGQSRTWVAPSCTGRCRRCRRWTSTRGIPKGRRYVVLWAG